MRKTLWLALILLLICVFAFSACDSGDTPQTPNDTTAETTDNTPESETDAHVHAFGEWTTVKDATCTIKGEQERSCLCGEKETKSIDVLGHAEVTDEAVAATCTTDGKTEGRHCSVCNETLIAQNDIPASHAEGEWVIDTNASCTGNGSKHQVCSVCSTTINTETIAATGHTDGEWIINKEATCSSEGLRHKECIICKCETIEESIPCIPHEYEETLQLKSCISEASYLYYCHMCSSNYTTPISVISATIVKTKNDYIREKTYIDGYIPSYNYYDYATYEIHATGGLGVYQYKYEVIRENSSSDILIDSISSSSNSYMILEDGFNLNDIVLRITISDQSGQKTIYEIEVNDKYVGYPINILSENIPIEHDYSNWIVDKEATCTESGRKHQTCSLCKDENHEEISATGHADGDWIVDKESSCTEDGATHQICSVCQESIRNITIRATGHSYSKQYNANSDVLIYTCQNCNDSYSISADIELKIKETYTKFDTVDFKIQTQINVEATGGYGTIYYKYEVFLTKSSTTPIEKLTSDFSSDKDWYGLKAADTVNGCVIQVTAKDDYGHVTVTRVLITNDGIEIID